MLSKANMKTWLIILLIANCTAAEVELSPLAFWDENGVTVAGWANGTAGSTLSQLDGPFGISITRNNVLFISDTRNHRIVVVQLSSPTYVSTIGSGPGAKSNRFNSPYDLFVTNTSIYVIDEQNHRVQKLTLKGSDPSTVLSLSVLSWPYYLYVDNNDNIYLSDTLSHRVLLFLSNSTNGALIAGNGTAGSSTNQLYQPYGVFVNSIGIIYIADFHNHRIMKWSPGDTSGIIVAGDGTPGSSSTKLNNPSQIIVDINEYMYISEAGNSRITRWGPNSTFGVCVAACTGTNGTTSTQLNVPHSLAFDSNGSLYVSDRDNHRVQKFQIIYNRKETTALAQVSTSTTEILESTTSDSSPFTSETNPTSLSHQTDQRPLSSFVATNCPNLTNIGPNCNKSGAFCDMLRPCRNYGTCHESNDDHGFYCSCLFGFDGIWCENDHRPCKEYTCWNHGTCTNTSDTTFNCSCTPGFVGKHCERIINYCNNVTCQNHGVCRPLLLNYSCECLSGSYSGRHCEITAKKIMIYKIVSKSFAYIAIIAMVIVAMFAIIMDVLKYCFGIDPTLEELE